MAADTARKRKFFEEFAQSVFVFALVRVDFGVSALQIARPQNARCSMALSSQENHIQVVLLDQLVQVNVGERKAGNCSPVAQEPVLDVLWLQRFSKQRIVLEINHSETQVLASAPIGMGFP